MKLISGRWVAPALAMIAVTAAVTVASAVWPREVDPCIDPYRLLDPMKIDATSRPLPGHEWRPVRNGRGLRKGEVGRSRSRAGVLGFLMLRDWGVPLELQNPGYAVPSDIEADHMELRWVEEGETRLPVHYVSQSMGDVTLFAMYTYVYDGRPVTGVFSTRVRHLIDELLNGSRPITLFAITATVRFQNLEQIEGRAERWIRSAWQNYEAACGTS